MLWWTVLACGPKTPPPTASPVTFHIAAINDWHGALDAQTDRRDPSRAWGGLPWVVGVLDDLRASHPDLIVLDGGDAFQGTWPINATRGAGAVDAFALMGVDAAAVGNHEFDYGGDEHHPTRGALHAAAAQAPFAWLAANVFDEQGQPWQPPGISRTTIIERNGAKLGVIGLSTMETPQTTLSANVADLQFGDPVEAVKAVLPELEAAGVNAIAVVGHLTGQCRQEDGTAAANDCMPDGEIGRLLTELPAGTIDVIVAGHAHTVINTRIDDTFVIESRHRGHYIGRLDLVVTAEGVDVEASQLLEQIAVVHDAVDPGCSDAEFITAPQTIAGRSIAPNADALALIARLEDEAGSLCDPLGCTTARFQRAAQQESSTGNFVSDAMMTAFPQADLAIQNAGGLRADLPEGTLRREHVQQLMPFDNSLYLVEMTGEQLTRLFEIGTSGAHGMLQVSTGMEVLLSDGEPHRRDLNEDGTMETWEQSRLCAVNLDGAAIETDRRYSVITTDFLYNGGDHLGPAFADVPIVERGALLRDVLYQAATTEVDACLTPPATGQRIMVGPCAEMPPAPTE